MTEPTMEHTPSHEQASEATLLEVNENLLHELHASVLDTALSFGDKKFIKILTEQLKERGAGMWSPEALEMLEPRLGVGVEGEPLAVDMVLARAVERQKGENRTRGWHKVIRSLVGHAANPAKTAPTETSNEGHGMVSDTEATSEDEAPLPKALQGLTKWPKSLEAIKTVTRDEARAIEQKGYIEKQILGPFIKRKAALSYATDQFASNIGQDVEEVYVALNDDGTAESCDAAGHDTFKVTRAEVVAFIGDEAGSEAKLNGLIDRLSTIFTAPVNETLKQARLAAAEEVIAEIINREGTSTVLLNNENAAVLAVAYTLIGGAKSTLWDTSCVKNADLWVKEYQKILSAENGLATVSTPKRYGLARLKFTTAKLLREDYKGQAIPAIDMQVDYIAPKDEDDVIAADGVVDEDVVAYSTRGGKALDTDQVTEGRIIPVEDINGQFSRREAQRSTHLLYDLAALFSEQPVEIWPELNDEVKAELQQEFRTGVLDNIAYAAYGVAHETITKSYFEFVRMAEKLAVRGVKIKLEADTHAKMLRRAAQDADLLAVANKGIQRTALELMGVDEVRLERLLAVSNSRQGHMISFNPPLENVVTPAQIDAGHNIVLCAIVNSLFGTNIDPEELPTIAEAHRSRRF